MENYILIYLVGVAISVGMLVHTAETEVESKAGRFGYVVMGGVLSWITVGIAIGDIINKLEKP